MNKSAVQDLLNLVENSLVFVDSKIVIQDALKLQQTIHRLAEVSVLEKGARQGLARFIVRLAALEYGAVPASIHDLYMRRGRGEVSNTFTVPAINLRALSFDMARAVFRAARKLEAGAFIFEIARSEMGYTDQRPAEFVTNVLAAAIAEGYKGPVFIQGDHFQVSAKRYTADPEAELKAVRELTLEAIQAGYYNIDIDTSTLVDISKPSVPEQQALNSSLSAMLTSYIRSIEPAGVTISVGGEIGEVGGHNSTEDELCAYMDGYLTELQKLAPQAAGLSKISIQTGTSHGGVVLPDGSIAQVDVDFNTLRALSRVARRDFGLGGTVQHGASTLPEEAFNKFVEYEAVEVHLATNFMNMLFDHLPADLKADMYAHLAVQFASERKPGMTDEQFYYKTRKNAVGPFKARLWSMPAEKKAEVGKAWEENFSKLFTLLGIGNTSRLIEQTIRPTPVKPVLKFYLGEMAGEGDVSDLAD